MANSLIVIFPYQQEDVWMFDDQNVGLEREPFVSGVPEIISILVRDLPNASSGFKLIFSSSPFPGYQAELTRSHEEYGGYWYIWEKNDMKGWLCPALFKYFDDAPPNIYCQAEEK